jgi:MFS family permease
MFGSLCVGLGLCTTPAITLALIRDRSSVATAATAFVTITTVMSLGQIAGPAIGGALADRSGARRAHAHRGSICAGAVLGTIDSVLQRTRSQ